MMLLYVALLSMPLVWEGLKQQRSAIEIAEKLLPDLVYRLRQDLHLTIIHCIVCILWL